jgi:hypothetical protein
MDREKGQSNENEKVQPVTQRDQVQLAHQIQQMSSAERIRLARTGNKEVRGVLIRDGTRSVQIAVLSNPKITEGEIDRIASSRTVDDDVIRLILNNREWMKNYAIKVTLVKNPRTPLKASIHLLPHLRERDLKNLVRSKNVSYVLVVAAKKLLSTRQQETRRLLR